MFSEVDQGGFWPHIQSADIFVTVMKKQRQLGLSSFGQTSLVVSNILMFKQVACLHTEEHRDTQFHLSV